MVRISMQVVAATLRLRLPEEESRIDLTMDWAVTRPSEERAIADWRSWRGFGFGGRCLDWEREDSHCWGKRVALQACWIAGEALVGRVGAGEDGWLWWWWEAEERVRKRNRERRQRREAMNLVRAVIVLRV